MKDSFFNSVHILNFKSLKDVTLKDCKRINLLIGKPNVGKSNILEAISLFSLPYFNINERKKLTDYIRLENFAELFFDGYTKQETTITIDDGRFCSASYIDNSEFIPTDHVNFKINLKKKNTHNSPIFPSYNNGIKAINNFEGGFDIFMPIETSIDVRSYPSLKIKSYKFPQNIVKNKALGYSFLIPPDGINLLEAIKKNNLDKELAKLFIDYGLQLVLDNRTQSVLIQKQLKDNVVITFPYSSIADTLQRMIFFKTAIVSNKDSILLFEEPEAHCFPPYIAHFTQDVINSKSNQFFIATHSPYVLNDFLEYEETRKEVAIFFADFKDGQTVINRLTDEELEEVYDDGIDVFFNYERFTS